jgi:hypothetical protein
MNFLKRKNSELNANRYWLIYIPITVIMFLSLRFPLRIMLEETLSDVLFYTALTLGFLLSMANVYRLSRWEFKRLLVIILFCASLSSWQIVELTLLRKMEVLSILPYYAYINADTPHWVIYARPEQSDGVRCYGVWEEVLGNKYIAVAVRVYYNSRRNICDSWAG